MGGMSEYAWATVDPAALAVVVPPDVPALPELLDADAEGAAELPTVATDAVVDEPLVPLALDRVTYVDVYRRHDFPHTAAGPYLRRSVAHRLADVADGLPEPFGLAIFDAWRDPALQQYLYDRAYAHPGLPPGFVAAPTGDPTRPTPHSTGGTVDLTLTWHGQPLAMGTDFDEFTERAFTSALESSGDSLARDLRRYLYQAMSAAGFVVLAREWWHFEYGTRLWSAVTGRSPRYLAAPRPPVGQTT